MKQSILNKILIAASVFALACNVAFALDVTDNSVGGSSAVYGISASAVNKALVFNGEFNFATDDGVDGTNLVQLLSVPAGVAPERVWVIPADISDTTAITLYRKQGDEAWAAVGNAITVTSGSEVPIMYTLVTPTYANTNAANVEVTMSDYDTDQASYYLDVSKWGFLCAVSGTNSLPDAGTLDISVIGFDVDPSVRD